MMQAEASESAPAVQAPAAQVPEAAAPSASAPLEAPAIAPAPALERAPVVFEAPPLPVPLPAPAPRAVAPAAPAPAPAPAPIDPLALLESTGLKMVETDRSKIVPIQPEEPSVQLGRPRRERPRVAVEEPLQQVETKH